jgi:transcriptional regulator with XRE-family HTH domain
MDEAVVNPLAAFRADQKWSLDECARIMGVSQSTIIRTEQGCYNDIPPSILRYLSDHHISRDAIIHDYHRFQSITRLRTLDRAAYYFWGQSLTALIAKEPTANPFVLWREGILRYHSRLAFCKDLCLHPSTVKRVEDGLAERLPGSIIEALSSGRAEVDWMALDAVYRGWRKDPTRSSYASRT